MYSGIIKDSIKIRNHVSSDGVPYADAIIKFETREMAQDAIDNNNYTSLNGTQIRLSLADPETNKIKASGKSMVVIRNIPSDITASNLHEIFSNFGDVITCEIAKERNLDGSSQSLRYAYILFRTTDDALESIINLKKAALNGHTISVEMYDKRLDTEIKNMGYYQAHKNEYEALKDTNYENYNGCVLYVHGFSESMNDDQFNELFKQFGKVKSSIIKRIWFCNL